MRSLGLPRFFAAAVMVLSVVAVARPASAGAENPVVQGPIGGGIHGRPWNSSMYDVRAHGYTEEEFFFLGFARDITDGTSVPYSSRLLVRRPVDPSRFNGTAVVEWNNVTGQTDLETLWPAAGIMAMREGYAWVSVSAQRAGVCCGPLSLVGWDPARYAPLLHPGDDYSFDIYSQAIQAIREPDRNGKLFLTPDRVDPMGGLRVQRVIAHGASQSASRLTSYINLGYDADAGIVDTFFITRGGGDYDSFATPILNLNEEDNAIDQPDNASFVGWEEAGIAHAPMDWWGYTWPMQVRDVGNSTVPDAVGAACSVNRGTSNYTHRAALGHIQRWMIDGIRPPSGPRVSLDAEGDILRDSDGHALGGIRLPFIEAPVGLNSSEGCPLWGTYTPWSREKLLQMYPARDDYLSLVDASADRNVAEGFMRTEDAAEVKAEGRAFDVWGGGSCFDTANPSGDETGPVSSALHGATYDAGLPLGAPTALHDVSCNLVVRAGA